MLTFVATKLKRPKHQLGMHTSLLLSQVEKGAKQKAKQKAKAQGGGSEAAAAAEAPRQVGSPRRPAAGGQHAWGRTCARCLGGAWHATSACKCPPAAGKRQGGGLGARSHAGCPLAPVLMQWNDYNVHFEFPEPTELPPPLLQLIDAE